MEGWRDGGRMKRQVVGGIRTRKGGAEGEGFYLSLGAALALEVMRVSVCCAVLGPSSSHSGLEQPKPMMLTYQLRSSASRVYLLTAPLSHSRLSLLSLLLRNSFLDSLSRQQQMLGQFRPRRLRCSRFVVRALSFVAFLAPYQSYSRAVTAGSEGGSEVGG